MSDELKLTVGETIAGQIVNILDTQHPEINWPFETIAGLIDQGISSRQPQQSNTQAGVVIKAANVIDANDTITLEIAGSNDWVKELMPCVSGLFDSVDQNSPFQLESDELTRNELRDAFAAAERGESFTGAVIRTKLTVTDEQTKSATGAES